MASLAPIFAAPMTAYGQSCALCYQSAASSGPQLMQALRSGILILLVPPLLIGVVFACLAYRKRDSFRTHEAGPREDLATEKSALPSPAASTLEECV